LGYHIKPAARRAGIGEGGWHTFRHTNASVVDQEGIRMKVAQELLRHADIQTTMNVCTGAMEKDKQDVAFRMARRMLQRKPQAAFTANLPDGKLTLPLIVPKCSEIGFGQLNLFPPMPLNQSLYPYPPRLSDCSAFSTFQNAKKTGIPAAISGILTPQKPIKEFDI